MSESVNKAIIVGNLGKDPEVRVSQFGKKMTMLSVATKESWKDKETGTTKEQVEWHKVVIYNETIAGFAGNYLKKGSKVYIEGKIQSQKWTDKNGVERTTMEIAIPKFGGELVLLSGFKNNESHVGGYNYPSSYAPQDLDSPNTMSEEDYLYDLPF